MHPFPTGTVTLLFSEIEGSTHLLQQLGDGYSDLLAHCRQVLRTVFQHYQVHEVDTQEDSFFVAFARATDAIPAAIEAQRALAIQAWPKGVEVRVRMGIHTGEPQLAVEGYVGIDVHRAARIMSAGHGGQVLLSQTTRDLVEHDLPEGVNLRDLGEHRLKDLARPQRLFQLVMAGLPADFPSPRTADTSPNNLPAQPTAFIGREQEMAAVRQLMQREEIRLVTLSGPGGVGKTRLGLQVAAALSKWFPDGVYFVNLAPLSDPALVLPTIASTLNLKESSGQWLLDVLTAYLRNKELLLLLDNFEQVLSAAIPVANLLATCSKLKMLVTSRTVLHVRAEQEFTVTPLALPDPEQLPDLPTLAQSEAVALFLRRTQAVKPDFQLTASNARAVAEICVRLDGLPLAIELAAARSKLLPPQVLLTRLGQRLTVLTSGARDVPARQQTLRNTIAWSYDLLNAAEQRLFRRLSVFVGGCTLEAIEAVCNAFGNRITDVLDVVASLSDKSLVQQRVQREEEPRLVMLETIREYGLEALETSGEMEDTRRAHAVYYLQLAEEAEPELTGPQQIVWLERLEREHENLRAALEYLLGQTGNEEARPSHEMALRLSGALWRLWVVRGRWREGRTFLERALAKGEAAVTSNRAKAVKAAASLAVYLCDTDRGEALCEESLMLCRELGDTEGIAHILYLRGFLALQREKPAAAGSIFEEALALSRKVGYKNGIGWALHELAWLAYSRGEYAKALALCEESLTTHRESGNKRGLAYALRQWARMLLDSEGDQAMVPSLLAESLTLFKELDDKYGLANYLLLKGRLALQQGDAATARSLAEEGLVLFREIGQQDAASRSLFFLGKVAAQQGDYTAARAFYKESLALLGKGDTDKVLIASSLKKLADVVAAQDEPAWAARLLGAAEALRESVGTPVWPVERAAYERSVATARIQLGEKAFAAAWAQGCTMTPEQALAAQEPVPLPTPTRAEPPPVPAAKPSVTYPDSLTAREVEVLRLLAQGLTNVQIADHLVISHRTVNSHLTSIYGKIQLSSRSAATRYAIEHHLI